MNHKETIAALRNQLNEVLTSFDALLTTLAQSPAIQSEFNLDTLLTVLDRDGCNALAERVNYHGSMCDYVSDAVDNALSDIDLSEEIINHYNFADAVREVVEEIDLSDAVESAVRDTDLSDIVSDALEHIDLTDIIVQAVRDNLYVSLNCEAEIARI